MKLATEVATLDPQSSHPSLLASIRLPDLDLSLRNINCAGSCLFFPHAAMVHPASAQMKFSNEVLLIGSRQTRWRPSHLTHVITRLLVPLITQNAISTLTVCRHDLAMLRTRNICDCWWIERLMIGTSIAAPAQILTKVISRPRRMSSVAITAASPVPSWGSLLSLHQNLDRRPRQCQLRRCPAQPQSNSC